MIIRRRRHIAMEGRAQTRARPLVVNPFYVYIFVFGTVLVAYGFGWSTMYPPLSGGMELFFAVTFAISLVMGWFAGPRLRAVVYRPNVSADPPSTMWFVVLLLSYAAELAYARGIPLLQVLAGDAFLYDEFGIPSLHVFAMTFGAAFSVLQFHRSLTGVTRKDRMRALRRAAVPLVYDLAIVSRGYVVVTLMAWLITYLLTRHITFRRVAAIAAFVGGLSVFFGVIGDLRTASRNDQEFIENVILEIGEASDSFRESAIPPGLFWGYIYATSPLANFQNTVNRASPRSGPENAVVFVATELIPDFASKRILGVLDESRLFPILVKDALTVASVYAASYVYLGWWGPVVMFIALVSLTWAYIFLLPLNRFPIPSLALLSIFIAFSIFDNMIYYAGVSLQLAWPLLLSVRIGGWHRGASKVGRTSGADGRPARLNGRRDGPPLPSIQSPR